MKYIYYATLYHDDGMIGVKFYDFPSINTFGNDEIEAAEMAKDALEGYLLAAEDKHLALPPKTDAADIDVKKEEVLLAVMVDTSIVREREDNKLVKKTLSIPAYLDRAARENGLNFSQELSDRLRKKLQLN
ncbi:type II toxin-antitoxin system HicB family antitoxin [Fructobacillus sp. M158]|uniref:type II toxin-antitoxin system HicB family antitoxin n=1 Tax=Fructobacillus parabroussonetiae TaxID=2713174 RepID=UPI00200B1D73|nr:type II toxin-antitoxin system HicB family antitoxin [Fructobacillus parabroussonetiae]MCK8616976.1 type II toxin-antitoxin system HicB family antitoxin [Fructobacillus parabroussonetiae]